MSQYTNHSQQRLCRLFTELAGNELTGRSLNSLSKSLDIPTSQIFRDLKNLEEIGWAIQDEKTLWSLTALAAKPAVKIHQNLQIVLEQVNKINREYLGGKI